MIEGKVKISKALKNKFRETSRVITSNDRTARKYGRSQNTVANIARELELAYRLGVEHSITNFVSSENSDLFETWENIPPTTRDLLFYFSIWLKNCDDEVSREERTLVKTLSKTKTQSWVRLSDISNDNPRTFAQKGVGPLLRLKLFSNVPDTEDRLIMTKRGLATVKEYRRRCDHNDPTLPILSMRS